MSGRDPQHGRQRHAASGSPGARDGAVQVFHADPGSHRADASVSNVLQDIASALGGIDMAASWLYWERRGGASPSPLDGANDEQRALVLKALERVEMARRKPHPQ